MINFESGNHIANYILKILKNAGQKPSNQDIKKIKNLSIVYDFVEDYIDIIECPVIFNNGFNRWIEFAQKCNIRELCEISEKSVPKIKAFKSHETSFDELLNYLKLDIEYRHEYLETRPYANDIYYPYKLPIVKTKIRTAYGTVYYYSKPEKPLERNYGCYLIYDYDDKDKVIYVGKSNTDLVARAGRSSRERAEGKFSKIELYEMPTHADTNIYEMYYIAKYKPICNGDSMCEDMPSFEMPDIATKHIIELVKEEPYEAKQMFFEKEYISKEEFWSEEGLYTIYSDKNIRKIIEENCNNDMGILSNTCTFQYDLIDKDNYLCSVTINQRSVKDFSFHPSNRE